jgi:hypothetical protein
MRFGPGLAVAEPTFDELVLGYLESTGTGADEPAHHHDPAGVRA